MKIKKDEGGLKEWNINQFGDAQQKLKKVESKLNKLEKGDIRQLNEEEEKLRKLAGGFVAGSELNQIYSQTKARSRWIKERDCNSRYFHLTVNRKQCYNMLRGVYVGGCWVDEPSRIKECSALQKIQSEMDTAWVFKLEVLPFLYEVQDQE